MRIRIILYIWVFMTYQNSVLMLNILHRDFPDVAGVISERLQTTLPKEKLEDVNLIPSIVSAFMNATAINSIDWSNSTARVSCRLTDDEHRLMKVTELREMLIAVVLLFYHPEKIFGYTNDFAKRGVVKKLWEQLKSNKVRISRDVNSAVSYYKNYKGFKKEVDHIYQQIIMAGKYFE